MRWMALLTFYHEDHFDFRNHTLRTVALMDKDTFRVLNICLCQSLRFLPQGGNCPVYWVSQALWNTCSHKPCSVIFRLVWLNEILLSFPPFRTIIEWSESHDRGYGKFQTAKMEEFTFNDLCIKLGFPYLYCHQGDCEHVVVITDIR